MREVMYGQSSVLIASALFGCMLLAIEVGYRTGRYRQALATESTKSQINAILGSMLGVLALLLGFTFSLALQRYDERSQAVVEEANAIGTTYLRAQLLPLSLRDEVQSLLRSYLALRIQESSVSLAEVEKRLSFLQQANQIIEKLWTFTQRAVEEDARPVTSGLFIPALNDLIDAYGTREDALNRHVPELVFSLVFLTFLMTVALLGYASGIAGHRTTFATLILVAIIVLLVFLIVDLDRPRRGFIRVSQKSLVDLQQTIGSPSLGSPNR